MITTIDGFLNGGFPISDEIDANKLEMCLHTAEHYIVRPRLTDEHYLTLEEAETGEFTEILNGGKLVEDDKVTYFSGLKKAIYHLAFAMLIRDNINATSFGTVTKKDDYSEASAEERLLSVARYHTEVGLAYLKEVTDYYGVTTVKNNNNWFEEYI